MPDLKIARGFSLPLDVVTEAVGIVATRGAGKSSTSVVLIEEAHAAGVPVVVVDPTGVYYGLRTAADGKGDGLPFYVLGGPHGDLPLEATAGKLLADVAVDTGQSLVLDVSDLGVGEARRFVADFLEHLYQRKARAKTTLLIVVDEADEFAPQKVGKMSIDAARCLGAVERVTKRGRSRGLGVVLISQRTQAINKDVLDLVDTMFAMRLGAPRSRKTVAEWLEVKEASDELGVIDSLSSLPTGTAWVWSPVRGLLERAEVRRIRTFDSYATPKPGEARAEPAARTDLDLEALGEQMAATVERAKENDPAELHRRIRDLEQKNFRLNAIPQIELMDWARGLFPALGIKQPREGSVEIYLSLVEEAVADLAANPKTVEVVSKQALSDLHRSVVKADAFAAHAIAFSSAIKEAVAPLVEALAKVDLAEPIAKRGGHQPRASGPPPTEPPPQRADSRASVVPPEPRRPEQNGDGPTGPQRKVLDALGWWRAAMVSAPTRGQVAAVAGYAHPQSRGFRDPLYSLHSEGLVRYPADGRVALTDAGAALAAGPPASPSEDELQRRIYDVVGAKRAKMLRALIDRDPDPMTREELAAELGYAHAQSRGFRDPLYRLHSLELVEYPSSGLVRAGAICFLR